MAVHHVNVDVVRPGRSRFGHFIAQPGKVGREDRGSQFNRIHQYILLMEANLNTVWAVFNPYYPA